MAAPDTIPAVPKLKLRWPESPHRTDGQASPRSHLMNIKKYVSALLNLKCFVIAQSKDQGRAPRELRMREAGKPRREKGTKISEARSPCSGLSAAPVSWD